MAYHAVPSPPTGTVTLLFTDIEGSTKRWEHLPRAMATALARHDNLLRDAIEAHGRRAEPRAPPMRCGVYGDRPAARPLDCLALPDEPRRVWPTPVWAALIDVAAGTAEKKL